MTWCASSRSACSIYSRPTGKAVGNEGRGGGTEGRGAIMTWVRIDDAMPEHPKLLAAGPLAFALDVAAICYCARNRTGGRVPRSKVRLLWDFSDIRIGRAKVDALELAELLVACGRWHRDGDDYRIHDYEQYNPTRERESEARASALTEIRRAAGRRGGLRSAEARRHAGEANAEPVASKTEANGEANPKQASSKTEANDEANPKQASSKTEANDEANSKQTTQQTPSKTEAPIPIPIPGSHTHSPPNPPQADESGVVVEQPASVTVVRPVSSHAPVASTGEPSSPEARRLLEAIRSHEAIRAAAIPEVATTLEGRRMARGTPVDVLVEAI